MGAGGGEIQCRGRERDINKVVGNSVGAVVGHDVGHVVGGAVGDAVRDAVCDVARSTLCSVPRSADGVAACCVVLPGRLQRGMQRRLRHRLQRRRCPGCRNDCLFVYATISSVNTALSSFIYLNGPFHL